MFDPKVILFVLTAQLASAQEYYNSAAVSTDDIECSEMGRDILRANGSAVDAAITSTLCMGVAYPHAMGIGGGMIMTVYFPGNNFGETFDGREFAPTAAKADMYRNLSEAHFGPLSIAVPGELRGFQVAHRRFGRLKWNEIVEPVVRFARRGHRVSRHMAVALRLQSDKYNLRRQPGMSIFIDPRTNEIYKEGDRIRRPDLARTLQEIASKGVDEFYTGAIGRSIISDIRRRGSILTTDDLRAYTARHFYSPYTRLSSGNTLYTSQAPSGGPLLIYLMNILENYRFDPNSNSGASNQERTYHRIVEAFKFTYAQRTKLGDMYFEREVYNLMRNLTDPSFARESFRKINDSRTYNRPAYYGAENSQINDHGTGHVSVMAYNGEAAAITSTVNNYFGSGIMSETTGVILNNQMDDFSFPNLPQNSAGLPPTPANFIKPRKRPVSSACPSIVVSPNRVPLVVTGAAGGTKIVSSVALCLIQQLQFRMGLSEIMNFKRFHHQMTPNTISYENPFPQPLMQNLMSKGHKFTRFYGTFTVVNLVGRMGSYTYGASDPRRLGKSAGY